MKCLKCGFETEMDFAFCPKCGNSIAPENETPEITHSHHEENNLIDDFVKNFMADKIRLWAFVLSLITMITAMICISEFSIGFEYTMTLYGYLIYGVVMVLFTIGVLKKTAYEANIVFGTISLIVVISVIRFIRSGIDYSWLWFGLYLLKSLFMIVLLKGIAVKKHTYKITDIGLVVLAIYDVFLFVTSKTTFFTGFVWKLSYITDAALLLSLIFVVKAIDANCAFYDKLNHNIKKFPKAKTVSFIMLIPVVVAASIGVVRQINMAQTNNNSGSTITDNSDSAENSASTTNSSENKVANPSESENKAKREAVNVNTGETITLDFMEMSIREASYSDEIKPSDTSGVYSYYKDKEGEKYFYLKGRIKNTGGFRYSIDKMIAEFSFDDEYKYSGWVSVDNGDDFYNDEVTPLSSANFYMYSSVPDELIDKYNKCTITFGFNKNFGYKDDNTYERPLALDKCEYVYKIVVSK